MRLLPDVPGLTHVVRHYVRGSAKNEDRKNGLVLLLNESRRLGLIAQRQYNRAPFEPPRRWWESHV